MNTEMANIWDIAAGCGGVSIGMRPREAVR